MSLDIWLGWPDKPEKNNSGSSPTEVSEEDFGRLRFKVFSSGFSLLAQTFEFWAQTQLEGKGIYWILDLNDSKRIPVSTLESGRPMTGYYPEWAQCEERVQQALDQARVIPDRFFVVRASHLSKLSNDFPTIQKLLPYYRNEREKKKGRAKVLTIPPYHVPEDFMTTPGVFFGDQLPIIKGAFLCRGSLGVELMFICQGDETIHRGFIETLESIKRFIALGKEHQAWVSWS